MPSLQTSSRSLFLHALKAIFYCSKMEQKRSMAQVVHPVPPCYIMSSCGTFMSMLSYSPVLSYLNCNWFDPSVAQIHLTCRQSILSPVAKSFKLHFWSTTKYFASLSRHYSVMALNMDLSFWPFE